MNKLNPKYVIARTKQLEDLVLEMKMTMYELEVQSRVGKRIDGAGRNILGLRFFSDTAGRIYAKRRKNCLAELVSMKNELWQLNH